MLIASYNVENLFERAAALSSARSDAKATAALRAHSEVNSLLRKATYEPADKARIAALLVELGLEKSDGGRGLVMLRQNRGDLVRRPKTGGIEVVADGRGAWLGSVELKKETVNEATTRNTARVIKEVDADVLGVIEADSRSSLREFSRVMLRAVGGKPYSDTMLIEGNDDRGIDVGLMTKTGFQFGIVRTHIFELEPGGRSAIFSRDCAEYVIQTPSGAELLVLVNHFKSKLGGGDDKRRRQATRVAEIVRERLPQHPNLVVLGDLNDEPGSDTLRPLLAQTPLQDISRSPRFDDGGFPGTFGPQTARDKIDYILLSPALLDRVQEGGVFRKGVFDKRGRWERFDTITQPSQQASDHAAIWARLDL